MTRITLWVLSTLSALVLLFGYSTSTSGPLATSASSSLLSTPPINSSSGAGSTGGGTGGSTGTTGSGSSGSTSSSTVTGSVAQTRWGPVQVQVTIASGKVADVTVVRYPNDNPMDEQINSYALPILAQETVDAQSADIDMVSGATYTSQGYLESLQSALDQAGL